jgi:DNA-binding transcriptional MerR regulator
MAETIGSLVDKISIAELKRYHMQEQADRADAAPEHRERCRQRVEIITQQRDDLAQELSELIQLWTEGKWRPKVYRQFKMYNDPQYQSKPPLHAR